MRHVHQGLFFNVSSSSKPAFSFDIKSGYLSTVNLIFRTTDLQIIEADLKTRFGDVPDFFDDDAVATMHTQEITSAIDRQVDIINKMKAKAGA